ncbi:MAG: DMT family transporter [Desulfofustis sp.]|nr:DMT family transporter [Desulfofustis sp.]MBT8345134.1 DMT family transporter [Desulfofustis sp.]MBT8355964.1 DMT family transporter [Desulfofustis sp.]NNK58544.1 DMT family transporter [Desulfofustis sp.]RZW24678.1 MAG: DMT family transporter [Desulfobulbaceae bacterium]
MTYVSLILTMLFWGGTFIAGRILAKTVPAADAAFFRFVLAAVALAFLTRLIDGHLRLPPRDRILGLLLLGFTGVFSYNICFFTGLKYIEAGRAALIIALNPMAITIGAVLLYGERLSRLQCFGLLISLFGALLVITNGDPTLFFAGGFGRGETAIIGCVIAWAGYSLIGRSILKSMTPLSAVFYSALFGSVMLFPATLLDGTLPSPGSYAAVDWMSLLFLGIFGTAAGFTFYYRAITKIGAARSSVFINLVPLFSILLAWIFLAEMINISVLIGGIILMAGVYLTNKKPRAIRNSQEVA